MKSTTLTLILTSASASTYKKIKDKRKKIKGKFILHRPTTADLFTVALRIGESSFDYVGCALAKEEDKS